MKKTEFYIFPIILFYLSVICLYVSYDYLFGTYLNSTKSIYQPYKSFVQISSSYHRNIIITILKTLTGIIGFIYFIISQRRVNLFNTIFLFLNASEILIVFLLQFFIFKTSDYINKTSIILSAIIIIILIYFYLKKSKIPKLALIVFLSFISTLISYYLH